MNPPQVGSSYTAHSNIAQTVASVCAAHRVVPMQLAPLELQPGAFEHAVGVNRSQGAPSMPDHPSGTSQVRMEQPGVWQAEGSSM